MDVNISKNKLIGREMVINTESKYIGENLSELSKLLGEEVKVYDVTLSHYLNSEEIFDEMKTFYFILFKNKKYVFINSLIRGVQNTRTIFNLEDYEIYNKPEYIDAIESFYKNDFEKLSNEVSMFGNVKKLSDNILELEYFNGLDDNILKEMKSLKSLTKEQVSVMNEDYSKLIDYSYTSNIFLNAHTVSTNSVIDGAIRCYDIDNNFMIKGDNCPKTFFMIDGDDKDVYYKLNEVYFYGGEVDNTVLEYLIYLYGYEENHFDTFEVVEQYDNGILVYKDKRYD